MNRLQNCFRWSRNYRSPTMKLWLPRVVDWSEDNVPKPVFARVQGYATRCSSRDPHASGKLAFSRFPRKPETQFSTSDTERSRELIDGSTLDHLPVAMVLIDTLWEMATEQNFIYPEPYLRQNSPPIPTKVPSTELTRLACQDELVRQHLQRWSSVSIEFFLEKDSITPSPVHVGDRALLTYGRHGIILDGIKKALL